MIITMNDLEDIEKFVGNSCQAGCLAGNDAGEIRVRVYALDDKSGRDFCSELKLTDKDIFDDNWLRKLDFFKQDSKMRFDRFFNRSLGLDDVNAN